MPVSRKMAEPKNRSGADHGVGLYVHWPFCLSKCPYCDFNSHVRDNIDEDRYLAAYLREIDWLAAASPSLRLTSVFFGGGTPSLMPPAIPQRILERARLHWGRGADDPEVTLEANPTSVEAGRFRDFAAAGINRLSLGVQALRDDDLAFLGRTHSAAEALDALQVAQDNFTRVNMDLIYARPGQTAESWRAELGEALALGVGHISLYQLTLEEGTPFLARHKRGEFRLPREDTGNALYDVTQELTSAAGLPAYEISNHAAPGQECRHNLEVWRGGNYAGVGPGAHSRLVDDAGAARSLQHWRKPESWLRAVEKEGHGVEQQHILSPAVRAEELVLMGLRLSQGIDKARFNRRAGQALAPTLNAHHLETLKTNGFLEEDKKMLRATFRGRRLLDALLRELLA